MIKTAAGNLVGFVCILSGKEICVLDYLSYLEYKDLCAMFNKSFNIKDLEDRKLAQVCHLRFNRDLNKRQELITWHCLGA